MQKSQRTTVVSKEISTRSQYGRFIVQLTHHRRNNNNSVGTPHPSPQTFFYTLSVSSIS